ncbi:MAG: MoxR family ATPase [Deltaproteobacteria bacterium]|nr:MoxR family ATPase [Deltaproteobacteria bacterium]
MEFNITEVNEFIRKESAFIDVIISETSKVIAGQRHLIEGIIMGLLTDGHILVEGVPGLAKTLTIRTISDILSLDFQRIQFTPDLLPADIIGTMIYNQSSGSFTAKKGPVFTNIVLADEINRAPAKVQSALLEAMQERQVTIGDTTYRLPSPFLVMATQNPIEQEGTYPLPEAQVDRFLLKIKVDYPTIQEEKEIINRMTAFRFPEYQKKVITPEILTKAKEALFRIYVDEKIKDYALSIVFASRKPEEYNLKGYSQLIEYGASPRASICLIQAARAHAFIRRRGYVTPEDIKSVGMDVLRHRIIPSFEAEAENITSEKIIQKIFDTVEVP